MPILLGKRVVDQVQVDLVAPESLKAPLEQAQRRITAMLRELRRDENVRVLRAAALERLADTGLGAVHGRGVDQAIASLEPVKHSPDRVSRRYTKAKAELRDTGSIIQGYVGDRRPDFVKSHGHDPSRDPLSVKLS
jgi:predicted RecB family endonuclease